MSNILTKKDSIDLLGLDEKLFENYFKNADEFKCLPRTNGRYYFDKEELISWKSEFNWRKVILDLNDYVLCLDFALAQHFRGYVQSDWGTGRQREFGQKLTNWIKGQLGEIAVQKFLKARFDTEIEADFNLYEEIVPQDIISIKISKEKRKPKLGVGIKSSKPKSAYLVLGENEILLENRRSDVYIFCRPDIPDDHLLRVTKEEIMKLVKDKPHYNRYKEYFPDFSNIECEVAGFCYTGELEKVFSIPGQNFDGARYVKKSGRLRRTEKEWKDLISKL